MKHPANAKRAKEFYQNLGRLFYAIAASYKVVNKEEVSTLKKMIEEEWLHLDDFTDEFGTDSAYQIEIIFDWLEENQPNAETAFENFKQYKMENRKLFDKEMKSLIMRTAERIAHAFSGKNKAELVMLSRLQEIFKK